MKRSFEIELPKCFYEILDKYGFDYEKNIRELIGSTAWELFKEEEEDDEERKNTENN